MSDLKVVEENPTHPAELHIRLVYHADYAVASLYEGEELIAYSTGFASVKDEGSWDAVRAKLIADSEERAEVIRQYGPPPTPETVILGAAG